jgi:hypothetical protein
VDLSRVCGISDNNMHKRLCLRCEAFPLMPDGCATAAFMHVICARQHSQNMCTLHSNDHLGESHRVNVFTRQPARWSRELTVDTAGSTWAARGLIRGTLNAVTDDAAAAVAGSDVVIIAAPANAHPPLLAAIAPHVDDGAAVGALFAQVRAVVPAWLSVASVRTREGTAAL